MNVIENDAGELRWPQIAFACWYANVDGEAVESGDIVRENF
jgi:hypothetical protein